MTLQLRDTSPKGRGVFTLAPIAAGQRIEEVPVIAYPAAQKELISRTVFSDYPYDWTDGGEALPMGLGSFYNHSYRPNARYVKHFDRRTIEFVALRAIAAGEEITVNYNGSPHDPAPLWFPVAEEPSGPLPAVP